MAIIVAATSVAFKGEIFILAYTIESGVIPLVIYELLKNIKIATRTSLLLIGPAILSFESMFSEAWTTNVFSKDFFVIFAFAAICMVVGLLFLQPARRVEGKSARYINRIILITGSIYAYALLWLSLHTWFTDDNNAVMISLIVYIVIGLICYFYGLSYKKKILHLYGGSLIGAVVVRLILVDIWTMDLTGRIITFLIIGALLVSTAFLERSKKSPLLVK